MEKEKNQITRRRFIEIASACGALVSGANLFAEFKHLKPVSIENPLKDYPDREWEKLYRDIFKHDDSFVFMCCPNDTHNCLLKAFVKNGVVVRIEPTYGYGKATDINGNQASHRWDPRCCQKGLILARRFYGDRRVKGAYIRKGFKEWVDKGFPRDDKGAAPAALMKRGFDSWVKVTHAEAFQYHAKALINISKTYSGDDGKKKLLAQGYDKDMVDQVGGAGTRVLKFRGGMAKQGAARIFGAFRFANSMALLDLFNRKVKPEDAKGAGTWDSYSFHTDLPPGHPMVTGDQTNDFELFDAENANVIVVWGMNWIATKMPDSHWLTEARMKGTKVFVITVEYSATASKGDGVIVIRPGTDPAFALGLAQVMISKKLYDEKFVKQMTDLPTLIRMDTLERLKASDVFADHKNSELTNWTTTVTKDKPAPATPAQNGKFIPEKLMPEHGDFVMWDTKTNKAVAVSHNDVGNHFDKTGIDPALKGNFTVTLKDGKKVKVRTVFDITEEYLNTNMTPEKVSKITWAPAKSIVDLAEAIAGSGGKTLFPCGMGPNQFWNNDNKDRAIFLVAALSGSLGRHGGNVGSYAGTYKNTLFSGVPKYVVEDPFNPSTEKGKEVKTRYLIRPESMHYWANGERIMKAGNKTITAGPHTPTPTKAIWQVNSNSSLGNQKGFYDVVFNTLPKCEIVVYNEWWWTASCEFSDIVYGVDSWMEFKFPDLTGSNTNPFLQVYPRTPIKRVFPTVSDNETYLGVAEELSKITGDDRFAKMWHYVKSGEVEVYLQRIIDYSGPLKGYDIGKLEEKAKEGIPALLNTRTYPRINSYEQVQESKPWFTKTGRLEFYRPEIEFIEAGENVIVHREPSDATYYEPCAIVASSAEFLRQKKPSDWKIGANEKDHITRQMRNANFSVDELLKTKHPLFDKGWKYIFHTPKYRHGAHTTPIDTDYMSTLFGPFGDMYRRDKRSPSSGELYVDIHPADAKKFKINDGDYIYIDGDPDDLPFRGWQKRKEEYHIARLLVRARYYPGTPRGVMRMWFNGYMATPGSVKGHETRKDGAAKNPLTNYQSLFRYGGHQSLTRSWLKPTHQTQSLITRRSWTNEITQGFNVDVHCVTSAPRESIAKFEKAENGGLNGKGMWRPAALGFRPTVENERFRKYLSGGYGKT